MPELGRYLSVLEQQIGLLNNKLLPDDDDHLMVRKDANISAQGISYHDTEAPQQDELVELKLKLLPSGLRLVIIGRVVLIETDSDQGQGEYKISLDFEHLHEGDREILIKHIHDKQMEALSSAQES